MSTKQFNTRIQHKIDTYDNWEKAVNFKPLDGEIIIYVEKDDQDKIISSAMKIGDGNTFVNDLPFTNDQSDQSDWLQTNSSASNFIKNKPGDLVEQIGNIETKVFSMEAKGDGVQDFPNYYSWTYIPDAPYPVIHESEKLKIKVKNSLGETIFEETKELATDETIDQVLGIADSQTGYYVIYNSNLPFLDALTNGPDNSPMICVVLFVSDTYYQIVLAADQNYSDLTIELYSVEDNVQIENYIKLSNNALDLEEEVTASSQKPVTSKGIYNSLIWNKIKNKPGDFSQEIEIYDLSSSGDYNEERASASISLSEFDILNIQPDFINISLKNKSTGEILSFNQLSKVDETSLDNLPILSYRYNIIDDNFNNLIDKMFYDESILVNQDDIGILVVYDKWSEISTGYSPSILFFNIDSNNYEVILTYPKVINLSDSLYSKYFRNDDNNQLNLRLGEDVKKIYSVYSYSLTLYNKSSANINQDLFYLFSHGDGFLDPNKTIEDGCKISMLLETTTSNTNAVSLLSEDDSDDYSINFDSYFDSVNQINNFSSISSISRNPNEEQAFLVSNSDFDYFLSAPENFIGFYALYNSNYSLEELPDNLTTWGPLNTELNFTTLVQILFNPITKEYRKNLYVPMTCLSEQEEFYFATSVEIVVDDSEKITIPNEGIAFDEAGPSPLSDAPVSSKRIYEFANNIKTVPYYIPCRLSNFIKDGVRYIKAEFPEDKDLQSVHQEAIDAYKQGRPIKLFDELTESYVETLASVETSANPSEEDSWMFIFDVSFQSVMVRNLIYFSSGGFSNLAYPLQEKLNITDKIELINTDPVQSGAVYSALLQIQENVAAIAEGQTNSYVFTYKARPLNDSTTSEIDILNEWLEISDEDGILNKDKLKNGDVFFIRATDEPDYWWDKTSQLPQVLEAKTNLNNYVQKEELNDYATLDLLGGFRLQKAIEYKADRTVALEAGTIEYDVNEKQIYEWDELGNRSGPDSPLEDVIYIVKEG